MSAARPDDFWSGIAAATFANEAEVETKLVSPLLEALGYLPDDVAPKKTVVFVQGKKGRPYEADFVVFSGRPHTRDTSLLVVEAKEPDEELGGAKDQAESYAMWMRSPFYVLTNGRQLQLWQVQTAFEAALVLDVKQADFLTKRGEVEGLLRKEAALKHCEDLKLKKLSFQDADFSSYFDAHAQILRRSGDPTWVPRVLLRSDGKSELAYADLLTACEQGAVVTGGSGDGKSALLRQLLRDGLYSVATGGRRIPVLIELPDAAALSQSVADFARNRIGAHVPTHRTEDSFRALLRAGRVLLLCDGIDRVAGPQRATFAAEIRTISQDFPATQVFVVSRASACPSFPALDQLRLVGLRGSEQLSLLEGLGSSIGRTYGILEALPDAVRELLGSPFFLQVLATGLRPGGPPQVANAVGVWLTKRLEHDAPTQTRLEQRRRAMAKIASLTTVGPIDLGSVATELEGSGLDPGLIDELAELELATISALSGTVEVVHEVIADYLRALTLSQIESDAAFEAALRSSQLIDSALPLFLTGHVRSSTRSAMLWSGFAEANFSTYLQAMRLRDSHDDVVESLSAQQRAHWALEEVLDGQVRLARGVLSDEACSAFWGVPPHALQIRGSLSPDNVYLTYELREKDQSDAPSVVVTNERVSRMVNLGLSHLRVADARVIGTKASVSQILKQVESGALLGGRVWAEERLLGAVQGLRSFSGATWIDLRLSELRSIIGEAAGGLLVGETRFSVAADQLLHDIDTLLPFGDVPVRSFSEPAPDQVPPAGLGFVLWSDLYSDAVLVKLVQRRFERALCAMREVVERTFSNIASELPKYRGLPARWQLGLRLSRNDLGVDRSPSVSVEWIPVATWDESGADVELVDAPPDFSDARVNDLRRRFEAMGRPTATIELGARTLHAKGDRDGRTAIMDLVTDMVMSDLKAFFRGFT